MKGNGGDNVAGSLTAMLCPIILDLEGEGLRIAKLDGDDVVAYDEPLFLDVGAERDKFRVNVGVENGIDEILVRVGTMGGDNDVHIDPPTEHKLRNTSLNLVESEHMILVSSREDDIFAPIARNFEGDVAQIADEQPNDPTHVASLKSSFVISEIKIGNQEWQNADMAYPVVQDGRMDVAIIRMAVRDGEGVAYLIDEEDLGEHLRSISEVYATVGVLVDFQRYSIFVEPDS